MQINLQAGDFKLITGPSGCGKSTLLKIVASLISPTQGTIKFQGKDINAILPETYRQQVSYCTQTPTLFGQTVYDNLVFPIKFESCHLIKTKPSVICTNFLYMNLFWIKGSMNSLEEKNSVFLLLETYNFFRKSCY